MECFHQVNFDTADILRQPTTVFTDEMEGILRYRLKCEIRIVGDCLVMLFDCYFNRFLENYASLMMSTPSIRRFEGCTISIALDLHNQSLYQ